MLRHLLAPALACTVLHAGEAPVPTPLASLTLADGAILTEHASASLYGKTWNDPGMAWVRQQWAGLKTGWRTDPGFDLDALLASAKGIQAAFLGMSEGADPKPMLRVQADLGAQAPALFALLTADAPAEAVAVPGADAARRLGDDGVVLARHGSRLVFALNCPAVPTPVAAITADSRLTGDLLPLMRCLIPVLPADERANLERSIERSKPWLGRLTWDTRLVAQGLHEVLVSDKPSLGIIPVDRAQLDRYPGNALAVIGLGFDLSAIWQVSGPDYLDMADKLMHRGKPLGAEATRRELDALLAGLGVAGGTEQLVKELHGTATFAVTQGVPMPGMSLTVPRGPGIDALIGIGLARLETEVPAEGASTLLPIPHVPLAISLARDRTHWLLTSDAMFVATWLEGKPGGFLASPTGTAMLAAAPADAGVLGGMDTASALRTATTFIGMGLSQARSMPNEAKQAILAGLNRLARDSSPSWVWSANTAQGNRTEAQGLLGLGAPLAIVAAIAIPNLMESRVTANEAAAGATLRSGIFPAQIQFQAGGYMDQG